jgi:hypothetical protein
VTAAPLSFLPKVAQELADVLTDPRLGDCDAALESGPLSVDPSHVDLVAAVRAAFTRADSDGSMLILAFIGHGVAVDEDFYFLPQDGHGQGNHDEDVHLSQLLKEQLRRASNLDGLLVLVDTCHAGVGAAQSARWREVGLGRHRRRYELLTASADQPAYGGIVTKTLIKVLRRGIISAGTTIDTRYLQDPLTKAAAGQHPQRITHDGGGWTQDGDEGLWWTHNAAHNLEPATPSPGYCVILPKAVYRRTITESGRSETTEIFIYSDAGVEQLIDRQIPTNHTEAGDGP